MDRSSIANQTKLPSIKHSFHTEEHFDIEHFEHIDCLVVRTRLVVAVDQLEREIDGEGDRSVSMGQN